MVGRAGPIFAVQISYLVTGFGVFWAMLIYFLVPLLVLLLNSYAATSRGGWRR